MPMIMMWKQKLSDNMDTIVALATPAGAGGLGVLRISGIAALDIARQIFFTDCGRSWLPTPRRLTLGVIKGPDNQALDQVLAVYFPAPHSYTTQDVVEIQAHGSPAALRQIEQLCIARGARLAEPGEFTLRAFLGGRLDLSQAEAVGDLIHARSEQEARLAMASLQGGLSRRLQPLRSHLLALTAQVEAWLDYPEEQEEVEAGLFAQDLRNNLLLPIEQLQRERERGRFLREGAVVLLCGRPNVGKSSLFNALLGQDRALVSHFPGTTRDGLRAEVLLGGIVCSLQDSAGLGREDAEGGAAGVELARLGQDATRQAFGQADLILVLLDRSVPLNREDEQILEETKGFPRILLASKNDLNPAWDLGGFARILPISIRQGTLGHLEHAILDQLLQGEGEAMASQVVVSARQSGLLNEMRGSLLQAEHLLRQTPLAWELVAWELEQSLLHLGALDGQGVGDEVLEEIFSSFCLGK